MKPLPASFRAWIPGLLTALAGVACVRLAAPHLAGRSHALLVIFGYPLVPVGLGLIARQIRRRAMTKDEGMETTSASRLRVLRP